MSEQPPTQGSEDDNTEQLLAAIDGPADLHGLDGARDLAAESHIAARAALAEAAPDGAAELEQITDFIFTRTS